MVDVFVVYHAEYNVALVARLIFNLLGQILPAAHVMACIADYMGMLAQVLPAAGQSCQFTDMGKPLPDGIVVVQAEDAESTEDSAGIFQLVDAA